MAEVMRSSVLAVVEESVSGTLQDPASTDFVPLREGFTFESSVETIESDELFDDIGQAKVSIAKETPTASIPKYFTGSGVEAQEPQYGIVIESSLGGKTINSTEYDTIVGSTAGTETARAAIKVNTGEGAQYRKGQLLLIKDGVNGYKARNVYQIATDDLQLAFNLGQTAPAAGVLLGKAIHYYPTPVGHKSYSLHHYQSSSALSALYQAIAGCRTTALNMAFPANAFAEINFDVEGIKFYFNPIRITSATRFIDFDDGGGELNAELTVKVYQSPHELAREAASKMNALTGDTITVTYNDAGASAGKFTFTSSGATFELLFATGANTANTAATKFGFTVADFTGAQTYTGANAISLAPAVTPAYDTVDNIVVRSSELLIGDFYNTTCRPAQNANFTISTTKTDELAVCADNGVRSSLITDRTATFSAQLTLEKYEASFFDKFINNTTTAIAFTTGQKSAGNWTPGTVCNVYMPQASITTHTVGEADGFMIVNLEASGFVTAAQKDVHINFA